ncbi:MAG: HAMP domain-containing histidine kinase [Mogibacterium sp.]|nr:HAMP domain-containing histidine kinase [Mogibacterium sp.]
MADHTGERARVDTSSIKTTTLMSFVLFALFLVIVLWGLSNFFISTYYERARTQEVIRTADALEVQFRQAAEDDFDSYAVQTAGTNGIYIRIDTPDGSLIYDGTRTVKDTGAFGSDISRIRNSLESSSLDNVTETVREGSSDNSRLIYAAHIRSAGMVSTLYIIAPLYPDQVTVRILTNMLIYISFIVLSVSVFLAYILANRLSSPIENLTASAKELSNGNYNVRFDGASFTETKELAKALNKASYEMEKTDFYQREIIANVSHDLKTPLTMIRSYAEKIIDITGDNPEKRNADLGVIISETERLNRMVGDMLSVSNLQSNNVEMHMETFDLVEAAEDVYESILVLNSSQGYDINFHPCRPAYVVGDRSRIMQVMTNFVSNAVKYSGDNKYIDIKLSKGGRKVSFHCIDRGVGIPSDEISHVWDKYYRTSANHERGIEGTGLGLAIAKGILNLHNARYGVESEEGKGSDFWFELETVRKPSEKKDKKDRKDRKDGASDGKEG